MTQLTLNKVMAVETQISNRTASTNRRCSVVMSFLGCLNGYLPLLLCPAGITPEPGKGTAVGLVYASSKDWFLEFPRVLGFSTSLARS